MVFVNADMDSVGVAKQVVHVAEYFLVGADEKYAKVVFFTVFDGMDRQGRCCFALSDEVGNLAIRVTCNVLDGTCACGFFVKTLYGHDWEDLVYGPGVGK